jgi:hypothetical protein
MPKFLQKWNRRRGDRCYGNRKQLSDDVNENPVHNMSTSIMMLATSVNRRLSARIIPGADFFVWDGIIQDGISALRAYSTEAIWNKLVVCSIAIDDSVCRFEGSSNLQGNN